MGVTDIHGIVLKNYAGFSFFHVSRGCLKLTTVAVTSFENDHLLYFFNKKIFSLSCIGKYDEVVRLTAPLTEEVLEYVYFFGAIGQHCACRRCT